MVKTYINSYTGQIVIGNTTLPTDHMLQISNPGQAFARFALTNSQTGNASGDGLKFQMENLNSIIKNQENGTLGFGTNGRETDILIDSSGNSTFAGDVDIYQTGASQLQLESLNSDANIIINSGADGVGGANREEGFIRFYQDNDNHFTLGKRNNGQFVLLDHVAGSDVITVQDNGGILLTPANNLTTITGNVGIGVTPNASYSKLQVKAPDSSYGFDLIGRDAGSNSESQISFWNAAQTTLQSAIYNVGQSLHLYVAGDDRLVIDSSGNSTFTGNVGIGVTGTPSKKLHVVSTAEAALFQGSATWGTAIQINATATGGRIFQLQSTANSEGSGGGNFLIVDKGTTAAPTALNRLIIDSSGNVIINDGYLEVQKAPAAAQQTVMLDIDCNPTGNTGSSIISNRAGSSNQARSQWEQVTSGGSGSFGTYIDTNFINNGLSASAHGNINFVTGSSTSASSIVMTIGGGTQKGNVGIGTTSPASKLDVKIMTADRTSLKDVLTVTANSTDGPYTGHGGKISFNSNIYYGATTPGIIETAYIGAVLGSLYETDSDMVFGTRQNTTTVDEKMRITGGGDVLFGKQSQGLSIVGIEAAANATLRATKASSAPVEFNRTGSDGGIVLFYKNTAAVGSISVTASATAYNQSSSDERLKKNITNWNENVLDKFKDIKPKEFNFNTQENSEEKIKGYIAQNEVDKFPEAYPLVYNEEAKEDRHMFNPSGMTVYLMKAIQELKAEVDKLKQECKCKN